MRATISFEEDNRLVCQLIDLLTREQKNLLSNQVSEIEKIVKLKGDLLKQINHVAKNRYAALAERNFEPNENGMLNWIANQSNQVTIDNWDSFQGNLIQAKELNRLNGELISRHFNRNQQMLTNLRNAFQPSTTYGKNGQAQNKVSSTSGLTA